MAQTTVTVETATADDRDTIAGVLARSFQDDPVFAWIIPEPDRRRAHLPAYFAAFAELYVPLGETYVIDGGRGAALWAPAGVDAFAGDGGSTLERRMNEILDEAEHERGTVVGEVFAGAAPEQPFAYLQLVGVEPSQQGRGLGGRLLAPVLARCDANGTPAYLEAGTVDNRRLYERHGFATVGELTLPGGGPRVWRMWRDPKTTDGSSGPR